MKTQEDSISLYIHVPFCRSKCPYCAFYSVPCSNDALIEAYLKALKQEAFFWSAKLSKPSLRSIYIGGGTPTLLKTSYFDILFSIIEQYFEISNKTELSIEANPESLTSLHAENWKKWQNLLKIKNMRVSLGAQSFNDSELQFLSRAHDSKQIYKSCEILNELEIPFSLDLMFSLPGQTLRSFYHSLKEAINCSPKHISLYELSLEPATPFENLKAAFPDYGKNGYFFYRFAQSWLPPRGFNQYEVASFAKSGAVCKHNLSYWFGKNYIGMGPGAWGYIKKWRYKNTPSLDGWIDRMGKKISSENTNAIVFAEKLDAGTKIKEDAILALRTKWGVKLKSDIQSQEIEKILSAADRRFIIKKGNRWLLTKRGFQVANIIWQEII